jgi:hypothetical protein
LKVTGFNDAIATAIGDAEGCHLPWWVNFELEMCLQTKSERNNVSLFFLLFFYGDPVQKLQGFPFCPVLMSETRLLLMCGFMFCWTYLVLSWCFSIIKINAGLLSVLKYPVFATGIQISTMCHCTLQTFQD